MYKKLASIPPRLAGWLASRIPLRVSHSILLHPRSNPDILSSPYFRAYMHSYMYTFTHTFELRKHIGRDGALVFVHAILSEHIGTEKKLARNLFPRTGWHYHVRMYVSMCSALPSIAHPGSTLYFSYYERNGQTTDKLVFSLHSHRFLMPMNLCIHDQTKARNE